MGAFKNNFTHLLYDMLLHADLGHIHVSVLCVCTFDLDYWKLHCNMLLIETSSKTSLNICRTHLNWVKFKDIEEEAVNDPLRWQWMRQEEVFLLQMQ